MTHTYRLIGYRKGKPLYTRNERKHPTYRFYCHEHPLERRHQNRSKRMKTRQYFRKTREVLNIGNTCGWRTW